MCVSPRGWTKKQKVTKQALERKSRKWLRTRRLIWD